MQEEKRKAPRAPLVFEVRYRLGSAGAETSTRESMNLGPGGVFIRCPKPAKVGETIQFTIVLDGAGTVQGAGRVIWRRKPDPIRLESPGMGVEFTELADSDRALLASVLRDAGVDVAASPVEDAGAPEAPSTPAAEAAPAPAARTTPQRTLLGFAPPVVPQTESPVGDSDASPVGDSDGGGGGADEADEPEAVVAPPSDTPEPPRSTPPPPVRDRAAESSATGSAQAQPDKRSGPGMLVIAVGVAIVVAIAISLVTTSRDYREEAEPRAPSSSRPSIGPAEPDEPVVPEGTVDHEPAPAPAVHAAEPAERTTEEQAAAPDEPAPAPAEVETETPSGRNGDRPAEPAAQAPPPAAPAAVMDGAEALRRGREALAADRAAEAVELFRAAIDNHAPPFAFSGLGQAYEKLGDNDAAIEAYQHFIELRPNLPEAGRLRRRIRYLGGP